MAEPELKMMLGINIGFITNSSSVVYHFPRALLEHEDIKAFLTAFDLHGGFVGSDLWHRGECASIAMTKEQKLEVNDKLNGSGASEYCSAPGINTEDDSVVIIYGDEYTSIASSLASLLKDTAQKLGLGDYYGSDYN